MYHEAAAVLERGGGHLMSPPREQGGLPVSLNDVLLVGGLKQNSNFNEYGPQQHRIQCAALAHVHSNQEAACCWITPAVHTQPVLRTASGHIRATHACPPHPAALASVSYWMVLVIVRLRVLCGLASQPLLGALFGALGE